MNSPPAISTTPQACRSRSHEFAQAAIQQGTPPKQAHLMERLNEVFRARRSVNITDDVENITGTAPATFRSWCERHADAFR